MIPGERQTIARASHPTLGEGRAVYSNGPAFFLPDSGEPVAMRRIDMGGASSEPPRSWLSATTVAGERVELETTGRPGGDHHYRRWSAIHGPGWLVSLGRNVPRALAMRFEPDEGKAFEFIVHVMCVGRPPYAAEIAKDMRRKGQPKKRPPMPEEDGHWTTYELSDGSVIAFRNGEPPAVIDESTPVIHVKLGGFPPPDATRAQIIAWEKEQMGRARR